MAELTQNEAERKLKSSRNMLNSLGLSNAAPISAPRKITPRGTFSNSNRIPPAVKSTVAVLTRMGECDSDVARTFGISSRHAGNIERGTTALPEEKVESELDKIRVKVTGVIQNALEHITDDKLANNTAASNSTIIRNLFPLIDNRKMEEFANQPQVIVYAPTVRDERSYTVVES